MHTVLEMTSGYVRYESSDVLVGEAKLFVPASLSKGRVRQMAQNSELTYWLGEVGMTVPNSPTEAEAEAFLQAMCDRIVLLWKTLPNASLGLSKLVFEIQRPYSWFLRIEAIGSQARNQINREICERPVPVVFYLTPNLEPSIYRFDDASLVQDELVERIHQDVFHGRF